MRSLASLAIRLTRRTLGARRHAETYGVCSFDSNPEHAATRSRTEEMQALKNLISAMPGFSAPVATIRFLISYYK